MKRLVITENQGLWTATTNAGVRWSSASLEGLLTKMGESFFEAAQDDFSVLATVFERTPSSAGSQIHEGQAGA